MKKEDEVRAVPKLAGFDDMKDHWRLTFSLVETRLVREAPFYYRVAFILLKVGILVQVLTFGEIDIYVLPLLLYRINLSMSVLLGLPLELT